MSAFFRSGPTSFDLSGGDVMRAASPTWRVPFGATIIDGTREERIAKLERELERERAAAPKDPS